MYKRKYHIISGIVCLVISIVLPTYIHQYYALIKPWSDAMLSVNAGVAIAVYGFLSVLMLLVVVFLLIAMRELGGYMVRVIESNDNAINNRLTTN